MQTIYTFKKSVLMTALLGSAISYNVMALDAETVQEKQVPHAEQFSQLDTNQDNVLNWSEVSLDASVTEQAFKATDKDQDGTLDKSEYAAVKTAAGQKKVEQVVSDSVITTKAKAKLLAEESLKSLKISVETYKGTIILSGFVASDAIKARAEAVVAAIEGVKAVKNSLIVKG